MIINQSNFKKIKLKRKNLSEKNLLHYYNPESNFVPVYSESQINDQTLYGCTIILPIC
jgi:hypothetical protein